MDSAFIVFIEPDSIFGYPETMGAARASIQGGRLSSRFDLSQATFNIGKLKG